MKSMKPTLALALAAVALTTSVSAATWSTSDQWGSYVLGSYTIYNDIWGSGAGPQTLYVNTDSSSAPNFWAYSQQPNTGGIKSYPNASKTINLPINSISSLTGTFNTSGGTGQYDWAFDCWVPSEVMIWTKWTSGVGPWGTLYQNNVSIGGTTYNVYQPGGPWSFLRTSQASSGSVDLAAIFKWLVNNGKLGNGTVGQCQFGVEITSGTGTWTVNSCSITLGTGGGGGGTYYKLQNRGTGLCVDGMGSTANGANCGQYSSGTSYNQQWAIETAGSYVKLKNRNTGLYIDGMGRTSNGSIAGQWGSSSSYNQQWTQSTTSGYYKFRNRTTGLYLDGMGYTSNGANMCQWGSSSSYNQQFSRPAQ
jgi:hypothetical protein